MSKNGEEVQRGGRQVGATSERAVGKLLFCFVLLFFTFQLASFKDRSWEGEVCQTRMAYLLEQGQIEMQEPKK